VVVNEGFDVGGVGEKHDGFGHIEYGASQTTVAQTVVNYLNGVKLKARGQATGQVPGVIQRSVSMAASTVDMDEACEVGRHAVEVALKDGTGWMATILRKPGSAYRAYYDKVPLEVVKNSVRYIPESWLTGDKVDVTDDFLRYARPLIGDAWPDIPLENGLQRFARVEVKLVGRKLDQYVPQSMRH
jgi:6-phosphofructokinase 1